MPRPELPNVPIVGQQHTTPRAFITARARELQQAIVLNLPGDAAKCMFNAIIDWADAQDAAVLEMARAFEQHAHELRHDLNAALARVRALEDVGK